LDLPNETDGQPKSFEHYLWHTAQLLEADGLIVRARLVIGAPADAILRVSSEEQADLIVMATHGRSGLSRLALGSVAEEVIRHADLPVLLVRPVQAPDSISIAPDMYRQQETFSPRR
jgi:hypothetical protein